MDENVKASVTFSIAPIPTINPSGQFTGFYGISQDFKGNPV